MGGGEVSLESIGFYTLSDARAASSSASSPMWRCELVLTDRCNFSCRYCRPQRRDCRGTMPFDQAKLTLDLWCDEGLRNVRFSGGEPTLYQRLPELVAHAKARGVERIAISTNGSAPWPVYQELLDAGANDFSVSLDACCSSTADQMAKRLRVFDTIVDTIRRLAEQTYVTAGVVLTEDNYAELGRITMLANELGCADVRLISAAQWNAVLGAASSIPKSLLDEHPILAYRVANIRAGRNVRGMSKRDCRKCHLAKDDSIVAGRWHFPCIIHFREGGEPIGEVGPNMRAERVAWSETDRFEDPICRANCLDVCVDYNNRADELRVREAAE